MKTYKIIRVQLPQIYSIFDKVLEKITCCMHRHAFLLLQYSLSIVFFWFGLLKPLGMSPAQSLVERTVFWFDPTWFVPFLGIWEMAIGLLMLSKRTIRYSLGLLFLQIPGTFLPLMICPEVTFQSAPFALTLEGQYIIKNLILIAAAIAVGGTLHQREEETSPKNESHSLMPGKTII